MRALRVTALYVVLTLAAAVFLAPYVLALFGSLKPLDELFSQRPWIPPSSLDLSAYKEAFTNDQFGLFLLNTLGVSVALTVGQVCFSLLGAYAFSRLEWPGRDLVFWLYIATLMVPNVVTLIPLYTIMRELGLVNTYWAIFLPYALGTPYTIFLMRQFFLGIPQEVIDAARIDGASEARILRQLVVPLARPIIITATIIAFVFGWNNFLWPLIITNAGSQRVLTVAIASLQSNFGTQWNLVLAGSMIALVPLLVLFAIFQKQIVRSIQITSAVR